MIAKRKEEGKPCKGYHNGDECMRWWLMENPKQIRLEDLTEEDNGNNINT